MTDLANGIKILDERIDFWIKYILNKETEVYADTLFDITADIVDEWVSDMGINGYIYEELKRKLKAKGMEVIE